MTRAWSDVLKSTEQLLLPVGSLAGNRKELPYIIFPKIKAEYLISLIKTGATLFKEGVTLTKVEQGGSEKMTTTKIKKLPLNSDTESRRMIDAS